MPHPVNPNLPRWIEEYAAGDGLLKIAARHGVAFSTVGNALRKAGVEMRRKGGLLGAKRQTSAWHAFAIAAHERGETYAAIAGRWGVTRQAVHNAISRSARA